MGRASFVTPVYIFSSIKAGSGKASLLAHFAVYQNNAGKKVAIIDLDSSAPLKIKNAFPQSVDVREYPDLNQIVSLTTESRYQRTFYFTETEKVSYFPAMKLSRSEMLFKDAALRDFFLQTRATFDMILVNFPPGDQACLRVSEILSMRHLWHANPPISLVIATSELPSLLKLDGITRKLPALSFQLRENMVAVFNRVPGSLEEQKLTDTALTAVEIKRIFKFPNLFFIGHNEEFPHQKNVSAPLVLKSDSLLNLSISRLSRLLAHTGQGESETSGAEEDFAPCLDGSMLEKISPYLEKLQNSAAADLLTNPANIQIFLEESQGKYRIRVRLTGRQERLLKIPDKIDFDYEHAPVIMLSPVGFKFFDRAFDFEKAGIFHRETPANLQCKPVYRFDDCFDHQLQNRRIPAPSPRPARSNCPSPIIFRHSPLTSDIPTLSQILGFVKKQYARFAFAADPQLFAIPGVTHFFIPPEFPIAYKRNCIYNPEDFLNFLIRSRNEIQHQTERIPAYELNELPVYCHHTMPDAFARTQPLKISGREKEDCLNAETPLFLFKARSFSFNCALNPQDILVNSYIQAKILPPHSKPCLAIEYLQLMEKPAKPDFSSIFKRKLSWIKSERLSCFFPKISDYQRPQLIKHFSKELEFKYFFNRPKVSQSLSRMPKTLFMSFRLSGSVFVLESPGVFSHLTGSDPVNFSEPFVFKLPTRFKTEIELMDHNLKVQLQPHVDEPDTFLRSTSESKVAIDFKQRFNSAFTEMKIPSEISSKVAQKVADRFKHCFKQPSQSLKKIVLRINAGNLNHAYDILPIKLIPNSDRNYRQISADQAYRVDFLLDEPFKRREGNLIKSGRLVVNSQKSKEILPGQSAGKIVFKPAIHDTVFLTEKLKEKAGFADDEIVPVKSGFKQCFPQNFCSENGLDRFTLESLPSVFPGPALWYEIPTLYSQPYHKFRQEMSIMRAEEQFFDLNEIGLDPIDETAEGTVCAYHPEPRLEPYELELIRQVPLRFKKTETTAIITNQIARDEVKIPSPEMIIEKNTGMCNFSTQTMLNRKSQSQPKAAPRTRSYPFFKLSFDLDKAAQPLRKNFRVPPPDLFHELFANLFRQARFQLKKDLPMVLKPFSIKPVNFPIIHLFSKLRFQEGIFFVRRILHSPEKIELKGERQRFKIVNSKLRDLFKLAQQTSRKFTEVNSRTSA